MKIFSSAQFRDWDAYSIREQKIQSADLMETAANACFQWIMNNGYSQFPIQVFCGKGNNGGDGLALARLLTEVNIPVTTYILDTSGKGSHDFELNLERLSLLSANIHLIQSEKSFPPIEKSNLVIDALFGSGLNRPLEGISLHLAEHINLSGSQIISIDLPSGLFADKSTKGHLSVHATHTLSLQNVKLAFLMPENELRVGKFHLLPIGLSPQFEANETSMMKLTDFSFIKNLIRPRNQFSHKGNYGHAAIIAGSYGMMGAAVIAAKSCLHTGTGKLTCIIPACGYEIMQTSVPEAMCKIEGDRYLKLVGEPGDYDAMGLGPGIGLNKETATLLKNIFEKNKQPLLVDADALNLIALDKNLLSCLPEGSVITPHPKEFERLFGVTDHDFDRLELATRKAIEHRICIVLKGHHTAIIAASGKVYFNSTGNAGMAKGGMGDSLAGIITGFVAQKYPLPEAAIAGVYLHGLAGDIAASKYSQEAMQASNLVDCIAEAWRFIHP